MGNSDQRPPLSARLSHAERDFYLELRRLVDAAGLSCRALEETTLSTRSDCGEAAFFSKSQWARWLNGKMRPPRRAIRKLAEQLAMEELATGTLVRLWDEAFAATQAKSRPRQLPPPTVQFVGRAAELAAIAGAAERAISGDGRAIIGIEGTAGVGKTSLACHYAWQVSDHFPDGQLYVDMRGLDPGGRPVSAEEALYGFLDALGVPPESRMITRARLAASYRSALTDKRVLIVIDNARDAEQVRDLFPGSLGTLTLVTSRNQLSPLATAGAWLIRLEPFSAAEARDMLADRLGQERVCREPEAAGELIALCAHLPLALIVAAAHAQCHPDHSLAAIAGDFRDRGLDLLETGDPATTARAVFASSYEHLSDAAARVFRLLGMHPGPDISREAAVSLSGLPVHQAHRALDELDRAHLIAEARPGRFSLHDLLHAYAAELASVHDSDEDRRTAAHRVVDHYLQSAWAASVRLRPQRGSVQPPAPLPGVVPVEVTDHQQALAWFDPECAVLLALIGFAGEQGFEEHAWLMPYAMMPYLMRVGRHQEWVAAQRVAVAAARRLGDKKAQAHSHYLLGHALSVMGDNASAEPHVRRARDLFREAGDRGHEAMVFNGLAIMMTEGGRHEEALETGLEGLRMVKAAGYWWFQGTLENTVGEIYGQLGRYELALTHAQRAMGLQRDAGNRASVGDSCETIGTIHRMRGDIAESKAAYEQAMEVYREVGATFDEARAMNGLGDTLLAAGDEAAAASTWQAAETVLGRLAHPMADEVKAKLAPLG